MKTFIKALILLAISNVLFASETLDTVESTVYQATGTPQDIIKRAKSCVAQNIKNDEVRISDQAGSTGVFSFMMPPGEGHSGGIAGGNVIVDFDLDNAILTANSRVEYTHAFLTRNVKSLITVMAKDNRFKIKHSEIEVVQKSTGYAHNTGYSKIYKQWGSGWEYAEEVLQKTSDKVASCINNPIKDDNW